MCDVLGSDTLEKKVQNPHPPSLHRKNDHTYYSGKATTILSIHQKISIKIYRFIKIEKSLHLPCNIMAYPGG